MAEEKKEKGFEVFGKVDRDKEGRIRSEYPAWYFETQRDDLAQQVGQMERTLDTGQVPPEHLVRYREELRKRKERLDAIDECSPKLSGTETDSIKKIKDECEKELKIAHPNQKEMDRRLVDAHEEARRMTEPCCKIKDQAQAEFARKCGIKIADNGMITRNQMDKLYKISSKLLGENPDVEYIRR